MNAALLVSQRAGRSPNGRKRPVGKECTSGQPWTSGAARRNGMSDVDSDGEAVMEQEVGEKVLYINTVL